MGMVGGGRGAFVGAVHRAAAALDQQIELVAGCFSRDYENTRTTGEALYLEPSRCYRTYQEMVEREAGLPDNRRIDFASVVTPNVSHFPIARAFLEAGFHVVCDKPMTYTLEEAKDLVQIVERSGLVFALTHNYTGHPLVRHARHLCRNGEIGTVRKVIVQYLADFLAVPQEQLGHKQAIWRTDPAQSGIAGAMGDIGTHALNLVEYVVDDEVAAICADKSTFLEGRELDDDLNALLRLRRGGKGVLVISQVAPGEANGLTLRVYGSSGALSWDQENPDNLHLSRIGQPRQTLSRAGVAMSEVATAATRLPAGHPEGYFEAFANIYCGVTDAIRHCLDGEPLSSDQYDFPTVHHGLRGMTLVYAAMRSSADGSTWIEV